MGRSGQADLFNTQGDLFGGEARAYVPPRPDPAVIRARLHQILAEARAAETWPWKPAHVGMYRTIFPQMSNWLPEDEAEQLKFAFAVEVARLEAA